MQPTGHIWIERSTDGGMQAKRRDYMWRTECIFQMNFNMNKMSKVVVLVVHGGGGAW
jgi:hypothetical protein